MHARISHNVRLDTLNTLAVPATVERYARLEQPSQLDALLAEAGEGPVRVLGSGSNLVLGTELDGLLIRQCHRGIEVLREDETVVHLRVAGGGNWHEFVAWCLQRGYFGLENLALIPGTVGAAPIQNIGAYGVEVKQFVTRVHCRHLDTGGSEQLDREACAFAYRDSIFKHALRDRVLVEAVDFALPRRPQPVHEYPVLARALAERGLLRPSPVEIFDTVVALRRQRLPDPVVLPNAGSFFKNPLVDAKHLRELQQHHQHQQIVAFADKDNPGWHKLAAAWLIEQCGFRQRADDVRVHPDHALVIINPARLSGERIRRFAGEIVSAVEQRFGLRLEQEPRNYG